MNRDEARRIQRELDAEGIKVKITVTDTCTKRLVRYMTQPWRFAVAIPVALLIAWVVFRHVTAGEFWVSYGGFYAGTFIAFWIYELHRWAGGTSKLD